VVLEDRPVAEGPTHPSCLHVSCSRLNRSRPPADNVPSCCVYLLGHADWIKRQHWAPEMLDEIQAVEGQLRRMVDRPADKLLIGYCPQCDEALYARIGAQMVTCRQCEASFSVEASRDFMWEQAQDHLATAAEIARAVSWMGRESVSAERIRKWVERGRLERKGWLEVRGRLLPTYRIGDVAALVEVASRQKEAS
jgi:ribosomal protein L37AE/L43A